MGQKPNRTPSEHPIQSPLKLTKLGGEFTYPEMVPLVLTHGHVLVWGQQYVARSSVQATGRARKPLPAVRRGDTAAFYSNRLGERGQEPLEKETRLATLVG